MKNSFYEKKDKIKSLKNGNGIKYLLDEGCKILGNPIMMFDTSYILLMCTSDVVTDDWVWNEIVTLGTFSHETVNFFNQEKFIEAFAVSETVAFMESKYLKYKRCNGKLFDKDNVQLGNIAIVACFKPFEDSDAELIELFCEILSVELQNSEFYQRIERVYQESLIDRIISGDVIENELDNGILSDLYSGLNNNLYLAVVDITQYDKTNTHLAYFRDMFRKIQNEYKYYIHLNNIVIIISTENDVISISDELDKLYDFFEKNKIYAGISSKFNNIVELEQYFREAIVALNYGLDSKMEQYIFRYDDFRIEHFLYSEVEDYVKICNPLISLIQKYDKKNNSDLLNILYTHLLYGMNFSLTCEKSNVKPEELSHKLKELEEKFKIDWHNGNMLFNIFISIKFKICYTDMR